MITMSEANDFFAESSALQCSTLPTSEHERIQQANALVAAHLPLVRSIASHMRAGFPKHVELDELVSAGIVGLIDAVQKRDPAKESQFGVYARFRIRGAILDFVRSVDWCPRELRRQKRYVESNASALTAHLGREPLEEEVATASNMSIAEYHNLRTKLHQSTLISTTLAGASDDDAGTGELPISGPGEDNPLYQCIQSQTREDIADALDTLVERQRLVLTLYYYEELTMKEIGDILGIAESRISQIHAAALRTLRARLTIYERADSRVS